MLDGLAGTQTVAELDGDGVAGLIGTLTWQIVEVTSGDPLAAESISGIFLGGAPDKYFVQITRPPAGNYVMRWRPHTPPLSDTIDEAFTTVALITEMLTGYTPVIADVGALLRARTKDDDGNELGTFTTNTRPTDAQVSVLIQNAQDFVTAAVDTDIPELAWPMARSVIALRAAMLVELSYFPEQIPTGRSPYENLRVMYEGDNGEGGELARLIGAVARERSELLVGEDATAGTGLWYSSASPQPRIGLRTIW